MPAAFGLTTQIHGNHVKSVMLLTGFPLLLLGMIGSFCFLMDVLSQGSAAPAGTMGADLSWPHAFHAAMWGIGQYAPLAFVAAGAWFVIAYFFHDNIMRMATGAVPVTRKEYPKIYNMLENLCISRGMPMPAFEIIDTPAMNAFATGIDQKSFKIVLTQGLIENLKDDELEAVIGHELTHIMNRDVRLLIISVIFVGIISFLAQMLYRMIVYGGNNVRYDERGERRGGNGVGMFVALGILMVGYLLAIVIRFALSRKREYLADAGSIELTKNPDAMMRALMRIAGHSEVPHMPQEMQQMCIENEPGIFSLFATHPPIEERIQTIAVMTNTPVPVLQPLQPQAAGPWGPAAS